VSTALKVALVIFTAVLLQVSVVARLPIFGVRGDIVMLVAIAAGLESDAEHGAIVGFFAGLTFDLLLDTPVGLSALTYCLVGFVVGTFHNAMLRTTWWIPVLFTMLASALGVVIFAALDAVFGEATVEVARLPAIVAVVSVLNGLLSRPARWALRHALSDSSHATDRVFLRHRHH
jgi:rod shape-determining protein MreD